MHIHYSSSSLIIQLHRFPAAAAAAAVAVSRSLPPHALQLLRPHSRALFDKVPILCELFRRALGDSVHGLPQEAVHVSSNEQVFGNETADAERGDRVPVMGLRGSRAEMDPPRLGIGLRGCRAFVVPPQRFDSRFVTAVHVIDVESSRRVSLGRFFGCRGRIADSSDDSRSNCYANEEV